MSRIVPILMIPTYVLSGLLTNVVICISIGSEQSFRNCMGEETVVVILFWPIYLVGMITLQPILFILTNVVLVLTAWVLLRSLKKA